ncbi:transmembrane protein 179B-like [Ylistrum balloti]|uniref:transmembrane protein 179B-like n=1 Tax=Ylistrum balloti TaxID=509963 RepID=UPI0029058199|nr:transmembrane protein 179B-like [Ylistrum balloti]
MAMVDLHLLAQTVVYCCTLICGFFVSIPVGLTNKNFDGMCMLYGDFSLKSNHELMMKSSDHLNCNFSIYLNVLGSIFYSLFLLAYNAYALHKSRSNGNVGFEMWVLPFILLNAVMTIMILVSSCIVTVGLNEFCSGITQSIFYSSCIDAQNKEWINVNTGEMFNVGNFYELLTVAKLASWVSFMLWIGQVALGILRFFRNRAYRTRSSDRDRFSDINPSA